MSYLSLEEAAAKLGISTDQLVELRSQGQVRGFRDGTSWKFPDQEIDRLAEDLAADGAGSGFLVNQSDLAATGGSIGSVIGGDGGGTTEEADGSDINVGDETPKEGSTGSDVNLVTGSADDGSDVELVPTDSADLTDAVADLDLSESAEPARDRSGFEVASGLEEIDSGELELKEPVIVTDEDSIDIAIDPKEGSTGSIARVEVGNDETGGSSASSPSISSLEVGDEASVDESDELSFANQLADEDSDDLVLGSDSEDSLDLDVLSGEDIKVEPTGASSLELMNDLDTGSTDKPVKKSSGADVLSELDLLGNESKSGSGSGLISGDSENLLTSSGLGSGLGSSVLGEADDALESDDDLVIADDDAELMLDSVSDISVAGDSGINLMSPSDSGLSLESEPLDLAGSSLSALDLGAELTDGSDASKVSSAASESAVDLQAADEEFQLSPSGMGLDAEVESSSQVIEVEDSEVVADAVDFQEDFADEGGFAQPATPMGGDAFDESPVEAAPMAAEPEVMGEAMGGEAIVMDDDVAQTSPAAMVGTLGYEVPFTLFQCLSLLFIILVLSLGGMLMTDLVRNMWAYEDTSAPVSALTDSLISLMGMDS